MPKKYVYTKRGKTQNYDRQALEKAVCAVKDGSLSVRKAAEQFGVPKSTIGDRISGKHELHVKNGRPPCIPREIEEKIVHALKIAARRGIGLTRRQVLSRTNLLCKRMKIGSGYKKFKAGKDWFEGLKKRHAGIVIRKPEKLGTARARMMNREVIGRYFDDLQTLLEGLGLEDKPAKIWNCDEIGKNFEHEPVKVVAAKGESCLSRTSSKSTNITVMACVNAAGERMPPMFVVKGKTCKSLYGFNTEVAPKGSRWAFQSNGWMDDTLGERWFNDIFLKNCGPDRPQLLILDGHSSHETLGMLMQAMEENVHILALPPHTTHALQPLDKAVFGPLNRAYNESCTQFLQENPWNQINKWTFPGLFAQAWEKSLTKTNILSGFRSCGIYPLNKFVLPDSVFGPSEPTDRPLQPLPNILNQKQPASEGNNNVLEDHYATGKDQLFIATPLQPEVTQRETQDYHSDVQQTYDVDGHVTNESTSIVYGKDENLQVSSVIDISDPYQLFQLISEDAVIVDPLTDNSGNDVVIPAVSELLPAVNTMPLSIAETLSLPETAQNIDIEIETMFVPKASPRDTALQKPKRKSITHHRLLTSEEIIREKLHLAETKEEKEKSKQMKKQRNNNKRIKTEKI